MTGVEHLAQYKYESSVVCLLAHGALRSQCSLSPPPPIPHPPPSARGNGSRDRERGGETGGELLAQRRGEAGRQEQGSGELSAAPQILAALPPASSSSPPPLITVTAERHAGRVTLKSFRMNP